MTPDGSHWAPIIYPFLILSTLTSWLHPLKIFCMYLASQKKSTAPLGPKSLDQNGSTNLLRNTKNQRSTRSSSCRSSSSRAMTFHKSAVSPMKVKMDFETLKATDANHTKLHCNRFLDFASTWWCVLPKTKKAEKIQYPVFYLFF